MQGSCNCKSVRFECKDEIKAVVNCHCTLCRKMNGSAFSTYVVVPDTSVILLSGKLSQTQVSETASRYVCADCFSPLYNENPKFAELKIVYLGALDNIELIRPSVNIYCSSQLHWTEQLSKMVKFENALR